LLENFRYIDTDELNEICGRLYTKLLEQVEKKLKDIQFIAFDELSKSSLMIAYHFALAQGLPQEKFINVYNKDFNFPTNKVIVYIDDVIGSGREFLENWNKFKKEMTSTNKAKFEHFLSSNEFINLPLFTTLEGKKNVEVNSEFKVIYLKHNLLIEKYMPLELKSKIFTKEQIPIVKRILQNYGESLYPKGPLGYGGYGLLLAFFYNTPNNTLPVIWQKSPSEFCDWTRKWVPIFPRKERRKFTEI